MNNVRARRHQVSIVIFDGANIIDITGPVGVFSSANMLLNEKFEGIQSGYDIQLLAETLSPVRTDSGVRLLPDATSETGKPELDTLIVPGGYGTRDLESRGQLGKFLTKIPLVTLNKVLSIFQSRPTPPLFKRTVTVR